VDLAAAGARGSSIEPGHVSPISMQNWYSLERFGGSEVNSQLMKMAPRKEVERAVQA
jgi:3,4-dihydroxy-2-butanone 4-phosphate synthase